MCCSNWAPPSLPVKTSMSKVLSNSLNSPFACVINCTPHCAGMALVVPQQRAGIPPTDYQDPAHSM
eukprot:5354348-Amphidinium_carterae.7